jgi:hypothetical protein
MHGDGWVLTCQNHWRLGRLDARLETGRRVVTVSGDGVIRI